MTIDTVCAVCWYPDLLSVAVGDEAEKPFTDVRCLIVNAVGDAERRGIKSLAAAELGDMRSQQQFNPTSTRT